MFYVRLIAFAMGFQITHVELIHYKARCPRCIYSAAPKFPCSEIASPQPRGKLLISHLSQKSNLMITLVDFESNNVQ